MRCLLPASRDTGCCPKKLSWRALVCRALLAAVLLLGGSSAGAQQPTHHLPADGGDLLASALVRLEAMRSLTARLRCHGELFELPVRAEGRYWQLNHTGRILIQTELELQAGTASSHVQQLCDGRFLWETWQFGTSRHVGRIDLRQLQQLAVSEKPRVVRLGAGGLPALLQSLSDGFEFQAPSVERLDEVEVYELVGHPRRPESKTRKGRPLVFPHVPDAVTVMLGSEDLVPYRIEFRRGEQTLLTCELFEVVIGSALTPDRFRWHGGEQAVEDRTFELLSETRRINLN